jgi:hypothetical protein
MQLDIQLYDLRGTMQHLIPGRLMFSYAFPGSTGPSPFDVVV